MKTYVLPLLALLPLAACSEPAAEETGVVEPGLDGKSDEFSGVEDGGTLAFGDEARGSFDEDFQFFEYSFRARANATVDIEVTRAGSSQGLDTTLFLYRKVAGESPSRIGVDDDNGYGALSRLKDYRIFSEGDYVIVVGSKGAQGRGNFRLTLGCPGGECEPITEPTACHPVFQEALDECLAESGPDNDFERAAWEMVADCEGWVSDSTESICPDDDEPLCFDSTDALNACMTNARAEFARPTTALTEADGEDFRAFQDAVASSENCNAGEDAGCFFAASVYSYASDPPSAAQLLAFAREISTVGPGAYVDQTLTSSTDAIRGIGERYDVTDTLESALRTANFDLAEATVSVTETPGQIGFQHGDCEGGSIVAVFPSQRRVLVLEDLFCAG